MLLLFFFFTFHRGTFQTQHKWTEQSNETPSAHHLVGSEPSSLPGNPSACASQRARTVCGGRDQRDRRSTSRAIGETQVKARELAPHAVGLGGINKPADPRGWGRGEREPPWATGRVGNRKLNVELLSPSGPASGYRPEENEHTDSQARSPRSLQSC